MLFKSPLIYGNSNQNRDVNGKLNEPLAIHCALHLIGGHEFQMSKINFAHIYYWIKNLPSRFSYFRRIPISADSSVRFLSQQLEIENWILFSLSPFWWLKFKRNASWSLKGHVTFFWANDGPDRVLLLNK